MSAWASSLTTNRTCRQGGWPAAEPPVPAATEANKCPFLPGDKAHRSGGKAGEVGQQAQGLVLRTTAPGLGHNPVPWRE